MLKVYRIRGTDRPGQALTGLTDLMDGATTLVAYNYNGASQVVGTDYPEPNVMSWQYTSGGAYPDLDRFNRVVTSKWTKDLASDVDFYHVDLTWDRNSNITSAEDQVHAGFDVKYAMDNVDRLTDADEGTLSGGSITSRTRRQQWTLSQTGNWDEDKLDLNGDGDWGDTDEVDDCRTHNVVNELTNRNTNCSGGNEFTLAYDAAGNMTDDGEDYEYKYDPYGRLREVRRTDNQALVAEYKYNGLGYRIAVHEDTDTDGDVDANDKWYYDAFNERWQQIARFRESDTSPKEEFVHHCAGFDGLGTASYIDLVVCRDKDANTTWTSASDGVLEERVYYCQNQHADVSAIVSAGGHIREWVKYSAYGVPFGMPGGDSDSDGDCDSTDAGQIQTWISGSQYDVRGDLDLDGDVDATDKSMAQGAPFSGAGGGRLVLAPITANRRALFSLEANAGLRLACSRRREVAIALGRWLSRDSAEYGDSPGLYAFVLNRPIVGVDPDGQQTLLPGGGGSASGWGTSTSPVPGGGTSGGYWRPSLPTHGELTDDQCCQLGGQVQSIHQNDGGGVMCCQGRMVSCSWIGPHFQNSTARAVVNECVKRHEDDHHDSTVACNCCGIYRGDTMAGTNINAEEYGAYSTEINCLMSNWDRCKTDPQAKECQAEVERRIDKCKAKAAEYGPTP